jgi:hypothetical protein
MRRYGKNFQFLSVFFKKRTKRTNLSKKDIQFSKDRDPEKKGQIFQKGLYARPVIKQLSPLGRWDTNL